MKQSSRSRGWRVQARLYLSGAWQAMAPIILRKKQQSFPTLLGILRHSKSFNSIILGVYNHLSKRQHGTALHSVSTATHKAFYSEQVSCTLVTLRNITMSNMRQTTASCTGKTYAMHKHNNQMVLTCQDSAVQSYRKKVLYSAMTDELLNAMSIPDSSWDI